MVKWLAANAAGLFALSALPASAATTSCSSVAACVMGTNSSSGPGVGGTSKSGSGLSGISTSGHGVNGTSSSSFGVVGITTENATSTGTARAGVLGEDESTNKKAFNSGISGSSTYGYGGYFTSTHGVGLYASSASIESLNAGLTNLGNTTVVGSFDGMDVYPAGGVQADGGSNQDAAVRAYANTTNFGGSSNDNFLIGVGCFADPDNPTPVCNDNVSIDGLGNAIFAGTVTQEGEPLIRTKSAIGADVASFGDHTAAPSLEDVGKGQLRNGAAYIALDRTFASTIDPHAAYSVFITPEGDSNGLYTSALSPAGFAVHENRSGRSSLVFDYRIIAKPLTAKAMHLPSMSSFPQLRKHVAIPKVLTARAKPW